MKAEQKKDEPEVIWITIPVDLHTFCWLASVAKESAALPETIASTVLRDVRQDDEALHVTTAPIDGANLH